MSAPIVSRGPLGFAAAIFAGGVSFALFMTAMLHPHFALVFLAYFSAVPLYLAGLGAGAAAAAVATGAGAAILFLTQPANYPVLYIIIYGLPAVVLTWLALRYRLATDGSVHWYPEGKLLTAITLYPCILFLVFAAAAATHPGGLLEILQKTFDELAGVLVNYIRETEHKEFDEQHVEVLRSTFASMAKIAPTLIAYTWVFVAILSVAGAQYILRQNKLSLRDKFSLQAIYIPVGLIYGVALTGLFGVFAPAPFDFIGQNLSLILGLPFLFVGMAVLHAWAVRAKYPGVCLFVLYALLAFLPWLAMLVAGIGIIDQWVDFRKRIANKPTV